MTNNDQISPEQAQAQIASQEFGAQIASLTNRVATLRVQVLQGQALLEDAHTEIAELRSALAAAPAEREDAPKS